MLYILYIIDTFMHVYICSYAHIQVNKYLHIHTYNSDKNEATVVQMCGD